MIQKRKGQLTVFIILGIILLLSIATVIYFTQQRTTAPIERTITVPEEVEQVYDYVATCVEQIGKNGLITLGTQAGYISVPPVIANNPNAHVNADPLGVRITPYWYYEGEDRTPTLENMQRDLALYVKNELPGCVGTFASFEDQFDITPMSDILPVVTFTEQEVIIEVSWRLDIATQDRVIQLTDFIYSTPLRIKQMHELARKTMETENKEGWLENLTVDLIVANPNIPVSGLEFSCAVKRWHLETIKDQLERTLHYNLPQIRIANTQTPPPLAPPGKYEDLRERAGAIEEDLIAEREPNWPDDTPEDAFEVNRMTFDVGAQRSDLKAAFVFPAEGRLFVNAQPNQGGVMSTAQMKGPQKYLRFLCMNQWHFAYDVIYPVKMVIRDDTAFFGEGFVYQFAFPVIIEDNRESRQFFGLKKFQIPDEGIPFCDTRGTQNVDVRVTGFTEGGLVDEELAGANITYQCVSRTCQLGATYSDGSGAIRLTSTLPEGCSNPTIRATKDGYLPGSAIARDRRVDIFLTQLKRLNYSLRIYPYTEYVDQDNPTKASRQDWIDEQAYTSLTKGVHATITVSLSNGTFNQYKAYEPETLTEIVDGIPNNQLDFIYDDATYDIDILLFKQDLPVGGYHAENVTIEYEDLVTANNVVFPVVEYRPLPKEDFQQAGMFFFLYERGKKNNQTYSEVLTPEFSP